jgi:hypothetical protein
VSAEEGEGVRLGRQGFQDWGFQMTVFARVLGIGRSLLADDAGVSSIRLAILIGLSSSAVLVLVRVGTAVAAAQ